MHRCPGRLAKCLAYTWIPSRRRGIDRVVNKPFCFQLFAPIGLRCGVELQGSPASVSEALDTCPRI